MKVSFEGIGAVVATCKSDGTAAKGEVVTLVDACRVGKCSAGAPFFGVAVSVAEDGFAGVQTAGFTTVSYSGTAPAVGLVALSADGSGGIKKDSAGGSYWVLSVDTAAKTAVILL